MKEIANIPYSTVEFDDKGNCISQALVPDDTQELIIVSHGWKNDRKEAEDLYTELFSHFAELKPVRAGKMAIIGVLWPSKTFDFAGGGTAPAGQNLVNAASTGGASPAARDAAIVRSLDAFEAAFEGSGKEDAIATLRNLGTRLEQPDAQRDFVRTLRNIVGTSGTETSLDASDFFFGVSDPGAVFENARQASSDVGETTPEGAGGMGGAAGLHIADDIAGAADDLLNIATYYEMKNRAGTVGAKGLAPLIDKLAGNPHLVHIHLVGHSFGARLVTAAAMASTTGKLRSLSLLQAAFSHNGFSQSQSGYFRKVVDPRRLSGPIIITHSENDNAVGKAYAIASRLSRDTANRLGDAADKYGGLGRNGAMNMKADEVSITIRQMQNTRVPYTLQNQMIHNLESSAFIKNHGDVRGPEVAWAISQVIDTRP
jgi:predicted alpha/beta hydrolase family esterase